MYEVNPAAVSTALNASSATIYSASTIARIVSLTTQDNATTRFDQVSPDASGHVTVAAGAEVLLVGSSDTAQTQLTVPTKAPVVIFQGKGGVNVIFDDGPVVVPHPGGVTDRVVVGSAGNDNIVVADGKNTEIVLGTGDSTVVTGTGHDTVVAGLGNSTIIGGHQSHAIVSLRGTAADYTVAASNGHAVITDVATAKVTDITKIQYVQLDSGQALVFANDSTEAAISLLYSATFGRDSDAEGLQFYFESAKAGISLLQIADFFTKSPEYLALGARTDSQFVTELYHNTFDRAPDADGLIFWENVLSHGMSRAEVIASFVNVGAQNLDGTVHTEATVVGQVTIVHGII